MKTRQQYLNGECSHRQYYAQFVTPEILARVEQSIGRDRILASQDPHLNDIRLSAWDEVLRFGFDITPQMKACGDSFTLSGAVCIAKEAAKQIKEGAR